MTKLGSISRDAFPHRLDGMTEDKTRRSSGGSPLLKLPSNNSLEPIMKTTWEKRTMTKLGSISRAALHRLDGMTDREWRPAAGNLAVCYRLVRMTEDKTRHSIQAKQEMEPSLTLG
jgi:hypothetical protein